MFWITLVVGLAVVLYALNKHFGPDWLKEIYQSIETSIYQSFQKKDLSNMALVVFWFAGGVALILVLYTLSLSPLDFFAPFAILISAFIASMSVMKSIKHSDKQKEIELNSNRSKFYLENIVEGLEVVYGLLKDKNNNRVIWIEAARTLENSLKLRNKVTEESHIEILEIKLMKYRHLFYQLFTVGENNEPLPISFFFGINNWQEVTNASEANSLTEHVPVAHLVPEYGTVPRPPLMRLHPWSVMSIFKFMQFPSEYTDPLSTDNFPDIGDLDVEEYFQRMDYAEGAKNYVKYRQENR